MIILKVTKKQSLSLFLENTFFSEKKRNYRENISDKNMNQIL